MNSYPGQDASFLGPAHHPARALQMTSHIAADQRQLTIRPLIGETRNAWRLSCDCRGKVPRQQSYQDGTFSVGSLLVLTSDTITPAARIAKVMPSDQAGGNFSHPIRSAMKIFDPMNTSRIDSAYLR